MYHDRTLLARESLVRIISNRMTFGRICVWTPFPWHVRVLHGPRNVFLVNAEGMQTIKLVYQREAIEAGWTGQGNSCSLMILRVPRTVPS